MSGSNLRFVGYVGHHRTRQVPLFCDEIDCFLSSRHIAVYNQYRRAFARK